MTDHAELRESFRQGSANVAARAPFHSGAMRCLRRTLTAVLLGLALSAGPAYAGDLSAGIRVANAVYPGVPERCGTVKVEFGPLSPPNDTNGGIAEAYEPTCTVRIAPGIAETYSDARLCSLLTHEWGHLAGRRFPDNQSDPQHSLDPQDNMYGPWLVNHPACLESDLARARAAREQSAALAAAEGRGIRLSDIRDRLSELRTDLRRARAAWRRARGARRARSIRRIRRLRLQIRRLEAEYRSLASVRPH